MFSTRTWAITGAAAALILVPAGASYAVISASENTPTTIERVQARQGQQSAYNGPAGGTYGNGYGDQAQDRSGDQLRNQVRDPAQHASGDSTRAQGRDQLRDPSNCDGSGPTGMGPQTGAASGRGGMMGGRS